VLAPKKIFQQLRGDICLATPDNKIATQNWISGESFQTFQEASHTFVDAVSVFCNVLFTIIVFAIVLGMQIALAICLTLLLASLSMTLAKPLLQRLANQIQWQKLTALNALQRIWDNLFFGDQHYVQMAQHAAEQPIKKLFLLIQRHNVVEQFFSCAPIFIAIPIIMIVIHTQVHNHVALLGALISVLPRSLQLFQNIHMLCASISNILFLNNKLSNLEHFVEKLPKHPLPNHISSQATTVNCLKGGYQPAMDY